MKRTLPPNEADAPLDITALNQLPTADLRYRLQACCAAVKWVDGMLEQRPYASVADLHAAAESLWPTLTNRDWLEAFDAHPMIGNLNSLKQKYANTQATAGHEQSGAQDADERTLKHLQNLNDRYLARFGFIFIVYATGKSASDMLALLEARINNTFTEEVPNAALEQVKITHLRLEKIL